MFTEQSFDTAMSLLLDAKLTIHYNKCEGKWYWSSKDCEGMDDWQGPFDSYFKALASAIEPYSSFSIREPLLEGEYISKEDATHLRVFEDFDGWAIDAANDTGNYSERTWTYWDGEPLTKEMAISKLSEFAKEYGRPDLANVYRVVE